MLSAVSACVAHGTLILQATMSIWPSSVMAGVT